MFVPRLIPRLDIKGQNLIKSINLEGLRVIGDPNKFAIKYYNEGADELVLMDSVASLYGRNSLIDVVKKTSKEVFIPITVGGGIRNIFDVENILKSGADKVAINTAAIANPKLITEVAKKFGSQCVVLSIEAKKLDNNYWEAYTHNGMEKTGIDVLKWIKKGIDYGAGEILLTSVDKEGTKTGFDLDLIFKSSSICKVPLIASGGCGETNHLDHLLERTHIDAIAVASILHYNLSNIKNLKDNIKNFYNKKK